jgi:fibronectin type 3 domain-containing protein
LGHLYVDSTAVIGKTVIYRIVTVDDEGKPTGKQLEKRVTLEQKAAPTPTGLKAQHSGRQVTISWNYPTSSIKKDDKIVRFNIYDKQGDKLKRVNANPVIRINNFTEFKQTVTIPRVGVQLNLVVMPVDLGMKEGPPSRILSYTVSDETPPSVVAGLKALSKDNGEVEITWPVSTEADARGYNLYRAKRIKGNYKKLNETPIPLLETFYIDRPPKLQTTYFYRVTAIDSTGNESKQSNASKADVEDHVAPAAPSSFHAMAMQNGTVKLDWTAENKEPDFKTYVLLRKQIGRFAGKADVQLNKGDLAGTTFIDKGEADIDLAEGARYRYQIFSADSARNFSDTLSASIKIPDNTPPESPSRLIVENDRGVRALLRWNASRSNDVTQYVILRGTSRDSLIEYRRLSANQRLLRDDSVAVGNTYFYSVAAIDSLGNEGQHSDIQKFRMKDFTPPRAVRNVRARLDGHDIKISWEPVPSPDLKGYRIYVSSTPTGVYDPYTEQLITDTRFSTGDMSTSSWIKVKAVDTSGNVSSGSEPAKVYIPEKGKN